MYRVTEANKFGYVTISMLFWALSTTGKYLLMSVSVCASPMPFSEFPSHIFQFSSIFSHAMPNILL